MNHRERVLAALQHREPDQVPVDLGGTPDSSICAPTYQRLIKHLGLPTRPIRVADVVQQQVIVDDDVRRAVGCDVAGIQYEPANWRVDQTLYDFPIHLPDQFRPEIRPDGSQVTLDAAGNVLLQWPKNGDFFFPLFAPLAKATSVHEIEQHLADLDEFDRPSMLDKSYEALAAEAKHYHEDTDYFVIGFFGAHIFAASQFLRGFENFLMDLLANPTFAEALMDKIADVNMTRFDRFAQTVGKYVHMVHVEDDLGTQVGPFIDPALYRKRVKPYQRKIYSHIKSRCSAYLSLHTDGAVSDFIPDFVEMGIDALNPVQYTARGMEAARLKRDFGKDITFWGGGCDTQKILPFGTVQQVRDEVRRQIDVLAPGGGWVCAAVHNITPGVPPENVAALFEAVREFGHH